MNNWSVYLHTFPNKKTYIGITNQKPETRWGAGGSRYSGQAIYDAIKKYGWENVEHKILFKDLSLEEANEKEKQMIKLYKSRIYENGYNIQEGGYSGKTISRDLVMEKWNEGENAQKIAREINCSIETVLDILDEMNVDKRERQKRQQAASGEATKIKSSIMVNQFDLNHNFIQTYSCLKDAALAMGATTSYYISQNCQGKNTIAHGFLWQYYKEENIKDGIPFWDDTVTVKQSQKKRVIQYSMEMQELNRFDSVAEANVFIGRPRRSSGISEACRGRRKSSGGYIWKYE